MQAIFLVAADAQRGSRMLLVRWKRLRKKKMAGPLQIPTESWAIRAATTRRDPNDSSIARHAPLLEESLAGAEHDVVCVEASACFHSRANLFIIYKWRLSMHRGLPSGLKGRVTLQPGDVLR